MLPKECNARERSNRKGGKLSERGLHAKRKSRTVSLDVALHRKCTQKCKQCACLAKRNASRKSGLIFAGGFVWDANTAREANTANQQSKQCQQKELIFHHKHQECTQKCAQCACLAQRNDIPNSVKIRPINCESWTRLLETSTNEGSEIIAVQTR